MHEWIKKLEKIFIVVALAEGGRHDMALEIYKKSHPKE